MKETSLMIITCFIQATFPPEPNVLLQTELDLKLNYKIYLKPLWCAKVKNRQDTVFRTGLRMPLCFFYYKKLIFLTFQHFKCNVWVPVLLY